MKLKLVRHAPITGTLILKSGTRVGGSKEDLEIGGMDNPVIRHPLTGVPYIPGSSIKGKMRSLLEYKTGRLGSDGEPCGCGTEQCFVCRIFGPHKKDRHQLGPTRIIVRDSMMKQEWRDKLESLRKEGTLYVEVKAENWIDRRTGVAGRGGLRSQERVPEGAEFDLALSVRVFEDDTQQDILDFIKCGLKMVTQDTLGGSGTRGYGWVKIKDLIVDGQQADLETFDIDDALKTIERNMASADREKKS
jgi:CRISPR-associated protein Csm3